MFVSLFAASGRGALHFLHGTGWPAQGEAEGTDLWGNGSFPGHLPGLLRHPGILIKASYLTPTQGSDSAGLKLYNIFFQKIFLYLVPNLMSGFSAFPDTYLSVNCIITKFIRGSILASSRESSKKHLIFSRLSSVFVYYTCTCSCRLSMFLAIRSEQVYSEDFLAISWTVVTSSITW